ADGYGATGYVLPMAHEDRNAALRLRGRHARRPLDAPQRIHGSLAHVVDGRLLDPILAPYRARPALLPSPVAPLPLRRYRADEHRSDLDSAHRIAPVLQLHRIHADGGRHVLPHVSTGDRGAEHRVRVRASRPP